MKCVLVSGSKDGSVYVWDTAAIRDERTRIILPLMLKAWGFGASGDSVITVDWQGQVARWQGPDFRETQPLIELGTNTFGICLSREGRLLAAGSRNGVVQVWDLQRSALLHQFTAHSGTVFPVEFLSQATTLILLHPDDGSLHEWDLARGQETKSWRGLAWPLAVAFSPDERWCLLLNSAGASSLIEMATGRNLNPNLNLRQVSSAAFSPDGKTFAAPSTLGFVRLWETAAWREVKTLRGVLMAFTTVAFSPDGGRLAAGSIGREAVKLWDTESYHELLTLEGQGQMFTHTAFSPDGNVLGSLSAEGFLNVWTAPSWAEIEAAEKKLESGQSP